MPKFKQGHKVTKSQGHTKSIVSINSYNKLITVVTNEMRAGLAAAQKALAYQRLKTYWTIGRIINAYLKRNPEAAECGNSFLKQVSEDLNRGTQLNISHDIVVRSAQFHREYPTFPSSTPLTFTHYLALMRIHDKKKRARMEARAVKQALSALDIKREISQFLITQKTSPQKIKTGKLTVTRGEPYIYALQVQSGVSGKRIVRIDCGFKILKDLPGSRESAGGGGCIVRVIKSDGGYEISQSQKLRAKRYTYAARVTNVVDGDTIDACVDVGFGIWINDRFRLRAINTPELGTPGGRAAKVFVERYFKENSGIVIRSAREGMYGRWLADIFALKDEDDPRVIASDGEYLNQVLLDKGLAVRYEFG